jgi:hypothetical protein
MTAKKSPKVKAEKEPQRLAATKTLPACKLQGYVTWIYLTGADEGSYERFEIQRAIFRDGREIAIDCNCAPPGDAPYVYTITLRREDSLLFRGEWSAGKAADRDTGTCSCRLYANGDRLAFVGVWKQDGGTEHWFAELSPIETFDDQR